MSISRPDGSDLAVAVAHWHVDSWGGAEYLVTRLAEALDAERIYTVGTPDPDRDNPFGSVAFYDVLADFGSPRLARLRSRVDRVFEYALWEDVDWRQYGDLDVLVTSGSTTRAVITPDDVLHVNYCHSPPRWFYDLYHDRKGTLAGRLARPLVRHLRTRDVAVDPRVDHYLANSPVVARRLWKYYKREAEVLYPPVDIDSYRNDGDEGFYLHLGRLDEEKGVPAIVEAFEGLDARLVLAGGRGDVGEDVRRTIERAENMEYVGFVDDEEKRDLLATCRAVVFNGPNEDFGIVPIEANASGKPCLARDEGFPEMFVREGENGYVHDGTEDSIAGAVRRCEPDDFAADLTRYVEPFSTDSFDEGLRDAILDRHSSFQDEFSRPFR